MTLAGHCSGLYQTIRDEGVDMSGRGAMDFRGGLVQVVDDAALDSSDVHIGKQPDLTDLFLTANAAPHLTIGIAGKTTRVRDDLRIDGKLNVGSNVSPASSIRAQILTWANLGAGAATMLQQNLTGVQTAAAASRLGFSFVGTYDLAGFNLTSFRGIASVPTVDDGIGTALLTEYAAYRGGIDCRPLTATPDAHSYDAIAPTGTSGATRGHAYRARNHGNVQIATAYHFRSEGMTNSPNCRPFQDEGSPVGDTHGNRFRSSSMFGSLVGAFGGGDGVVGLANAPVSPAGAILAGGVAFAEGGELKWLDAAGNKERISPVQVDLIAVNGNNNDFAIGEATYVRLSFPTAAFTITGIAGGTPGRVIIMRNATVQNMSITNLDANSAAANRIQTQDGLTHTTTGAGAVLLVYDGTVNLWQLIHMEA